MLYSSSIFNLIKADKLHNKNQSQWVIGILVSNFMTILFLFGSGLVLVSDAIATVILIRLLEGE